MPSPVAHSLIGLTLGCAWFLPRAPDWRALARQVWAQRGWLLLCIVLANAPDVDYLFGIPRGNLNYYHQSITHTLGWIVSVSVCVWIFIRLAILRGAGQARWPRAWPGHEWNRGQARQGFLFILAVTGSHLVADYFCADMSPPCGIMIAWPFSDRYWTSPVSLFPAPAKKTWDDLWTLHNVGVVAVELLITLPLLAAVLLWKRKTVSGKQ